MEPMPITGRTALVWASQRPDLHEFSLARTALGVKVHAGFRTGSHITGFNVILGADMLSMPDRAASESVYRDLTRRANECVAALAAIPT
jgi:hypothetical protein